MSLIAMHRQNIRALSLIVCTFTYLMFGAAIFDALESETDNEKRELVEKLRSKLQDKYNFSARDYEVMETVVVKSLPHKAGLQWKFAGAFYFATVVITTVGYGHSTPQTFTGKLACMIYALIGIPLNLVMFQSIGERLNALISVVLRKLKKYLSCMNMEVTTTHMIMVSSSLGSLVVVLGTYLFSRYENWQLLDSFYYCFVTLTTIGFGDYVALQKDYALQTKTLYIIFTLLFILFGMAIFAAAVNLLVLRFMATSNETDKLERENRKRLVIQGMSQSDEDLADECAFERPELSKEKRESGELMRASSFLNLSEQKDAEQEVLRGETTFTRSPPSSLRQLSQGRVLPLNAKAMKAIRNGRLQQYETGSPATCKCCRNCLPLQPMMLKKSALVHHYPDKSNRIPYTVRRAPGPVSHLVQASPARKRLSLLQRAYNYVGAEVNSGSASAGNREMDSFIMRYGPKQQFNDRVIMPTTTYCRKASF